MRTHLIQKTVMDNDNDSIFKINQEISRQEGLTDIKTVGRFVKKKYTASQKAFSQGGLFNLSPLANSLIFDSEVF